MDLHDCGCLQHGSPCSQYDDCILRIPPDTINPKAITRRSEGDYTCPELVQIGETLMKSKNVALLPDSGWGAAGGVFGFSDFFSAIPLYPTTWFGFRIQRFEG